MAKEKEVIIPAINIQTAVIKVVGDSPLIMHKWKLEPANHFEPIE